MNKELEQRNQAPTVKGGDIHRWNAKEMMQILQNFCKDESAADAKITVALPRGRAHDQDNFHIAEIKLMDNPIIGAKVKKHLVMFLV
tara:strand:+ start:2607 stop:2867 length:261 start_codon:yes stop_codon:yes gene_type:complete